MNGCCRGGAVVLALLLLLSGCGLERGASADERKEANYLAGMSLSVDKNYPEAIRAFEKSLRVRPGSASAHLQLGVLHMEQTRKTVAALYHFEKVLELAPDHELSDLLNDRIYSLRLKVASSVKVNMDSRGELEIKELTEENKQIRLQLAQMKGENHKLRLSLSERNVDPGAAGDIAEATGPDPSTGMENHQAYHPHQGPVMVPQNSRIAMVDGPVMHITYTKHVVQENETYYSLGRLYGVSWKEIQRANPALPAGGLQIGKEINIPLSGSRGLN